jgi:hypothetical protein
MQASYILYLFLLINIDFSFIFTWFLVFRVLWREYLKSLLTKLKQGRTQEGQYTRITTTNIIKVELDKFSWVGWGAVATAASLLPAVYGTGQKFLLAWLQHCFGSFSQPKTYIYFTRYGYILLGLGLYIYTSFLFLLIYVACYPFIWSMFAGYFIVKKDIGSSQSHVLNFLDEGGGGGASWK